MYANYDDASHDVHLEYLPLLPHPTNTTAIIIKKRYRILKIYTTRGSEATPDSLREGRKKQNKI